MAGINPCCHLSLVDHLYYCIHLMFVFVNKHGRLEYPHCSQVSISLTLDVHGLKIVQILCLVPPGCFRMLESHLILNCEHHSQRRLGGASTHLGMFTYVHPKINIIYYILIATNLQGSMMTFGYSFNIWVPLLLFPTAGPDGAPRWRKGWPVTFVFYFLLWAGFVNSIIIYGR